MVGNKVTGPEDVAYLREHTGADLVACLGASHYVRAQEQGRDKGFDTLEPANRTALAACRWKWTRCRKTGPSSPGRRSTST